MISFSSELNCNSGLGKLSLNYCSIYGGFFDLIFHNMRNILYKYWLQNSYEGYYYLSSHLKPCFLHYLEFNTWFTHFLVKLSINNVFQVIDLQIFVKVNWNQRRSSRLVGWNGICILIFVLYLMSSEQYFSYVQNDRASLLERNKWLLENDIDKMVKWLDIPQQLSSPLVYSGVLRNNFCRYICQ